METEDPADLEGQLEAQPLQDQEYQIRTRSFTREQTKVPLEVRRLSTFYNPTMELAEFIFLSAKLKTVEPEKFEDAWFNPDPTNREGWRSAITKELTDMNTNCEIWTKMEIKDIPKNQKLIGVENTSC
jgi:hypothetical protein